MTLVSRTETLMASVPTFCPSTCLFSSRGGSERLEQHRLPLQCSQVFPLSYLPSHGPSLPSASARDTCIF